ncbi:MAG TPA: hypothetical protein VI756_24815, partial [Blastocatellia bacterium]
AAFEVAKMLRALALGIAARYGRRRNFVRSESVGQFFAVARAGAKHNRPAPANVIEIRLNDQLVPSGITTVVSISFEVVLDLIKPNTAKIGVGLNANAADGGQARPCGPPLLTSFEARVPKEIEYGFAIRPIGCGRQAENECWPKVRDSPCSF